MKRRLLVILVFCLSLIFISAQAEGVSLEEALAMLNQPDCPELIELNDTLPQLDLFASQEYVLNEGKFIVVVREAPLRKFENSETAYDENYYGTDDGETKVYLHAGLMQLIPEESRAASVAEIGNVVVGESWYQFTNQLVYLGDDREAGEVSQEVFDLYMAGNSDEAEMMEAILYQQKLQADPDTRFIPVFDGVSVVSLYNWEDGSSVIMDARLKVAPDAFMNPEAVACWNALFEAYEIAWYTAQSDWESVYEYIMYEACYLEPDVLDSLLEMDEMDRLISADMMVWEYARRIAEADGDPATMAMYDKAIEDGNLEALYYIFRAREYYETDASLADIEANKLYTAQVTVEDLVNVLSTNMAYLSSKDINWNPVIIYILYVLSAG